MDIPELFYSDDEDEYSKFEEMHKKLLMMLYIRMGGFFQQARIQLGDLYEVGWINEYCPTIAGGYAYTAHMQNSYLMPDTVFTDDIDVKIAIRQTQENLNGPKKNSMRRCIKQFRVNLLRIVAEAVKEHLGASVMYQLSMVGVFGSDVQALVESVKEPISPLQLCSLVITYQDARGSKYPFGLIDTSFVMREYNDFADGLILKDFNSFMKMNGTGPTTATHLFEPTVRIKNGDTVESSMFVASLDFMLFDTVRMMSKVNTYGDISISDPSGISDIYKFDKYVLKFVQLCMLQIRQCGLLTAEYFHHLKMCKPFLDSIRVVPGASRDPRTLKAKLAMVRSHPFFGKVFRSLETYLNHVNEMKVDQIGSGPGDSEELLLVRHRKFYGPPPRCKMFD